MVCKRKIARVSCYGGFGGHKNTKKMGENESSMAPNQVSYIVTMEEKENCVFSCGVCLCNCGMSVHQEIEIVTFGKGESSCREKRS